jgi:hypothetical protein
MSAFLGKIHYWLYDKIKLQERILENISELAEKNGYKTESLIAESYSKYGNPVTGSLENEIEHSNIHGWLQERIISVESRLAYVVTELLKSDAVKKEEVADIFYKNGIDTMNKLGINEGTPEEFFNLIFDYMLEGMPCDRVNEVTDNNEIMITWETTIDLHREYWDAVGGNFNNYHYFRNSWINGFLAGSGAGYIYTRTEDGINTIRKA